MKVLLVQPTPPRSAWPRGTFRSRWVPSGLASIAAVLRRAGCDVRVHAREEHLMKCGLDWPAADALLRRLIDEFRPEMLGLSLTTPALAEGERIAGWVRRTCPHAVILAGGPHPSAVPELTLHDCASVDAAVVGEGEQTAVEVARHGLDESVAGLVLRRDGAMVRTAARPPVADLDSLPDPPYDLFDMAHYTAADRFLIRWIPLRALNVRTSRGCTHRCTFCAGHVVAGVGVRVHSIQRVVAQVAAGVERFGIEAVHFEDDTMGADPRRLGELCEALRRRDLHRRVRWDCCLRVDQVSPPLLRDMRSAGCIQVEYGLESGSDESLRRLGKRSTAEMNRRAVSLAREAHLRVFADIMVGLPGETEADFRATLKFLRWARPEVLSAARLCPLPGTPVYDALPAATRDSLDWAGYAYIDEPGFRLNLTAMGDERFEGLYRRFQRHFTRPAVMWQFLCDTPPGDAEERRGLRRKLRRFIVRHPLRALRVPWRRQ